MNGQEIKKNRAVERRSRRQRLDGKDSRRIFQGVFHCESQEHAEFFPMYTVRLEALLEMAEILPHEARFRVSGLGFRV